MDAVYVIDMIGSFVFAISGVLAAAEHRLDFFGAGILGTVTAIGGGTLRDMMIGSTPVGWMQDSSYFIMIILGIMTAIIFRKRIVKLRKTLFLFDAIGIAMFTIIGINKTLALGLPLTTALLMGTVSGVFGGVVRDVLANEVPLIFRKDFYATVCVLGGICYLVLLKLELSQLISMSISIVLIIVLRVLAVKYRWRLPMFHLG